MNGTTTLMRIDIDHESQKFSDLRSWISGSRDLGISGSWDGQDGCDQDGYDQDRRVWPCMALYRPVGPWYHAILDSLMYTSP